jgi:hypothetical protein
MTEPSPERGVFRWAYYHAVRDRAKFWVGSVGLTAAVVVVGTQVSLPAHDSASWGVGSSTPPQTRPDVPA